MLTNSLLKNYPIPSVSMTFKDIEKILSKICDGYDKVNKTIECLRFTNSSHYFLLSKTFVQNYYDWQQKLTTKPVINNSYILEREHETISNGTIVDNYSFVNEKVWKTLIKYFGGGPEFKIPYEQGMIISDIFSLKVINADHFGFYNLLLFNKKTVNK